MNFGVIVEIIDKAVFHGKSTDADSRSRQYQQCQQQHRQTEAGSDSGQPQGHITGVIMGVIGVAGGQQGQQHRHQQIADQQCHADTKGHHPAKIHHRTNIADHQRGETDHGGQDHVHRRAHHVQGGLLHQPARLCQRITLLKLAITDDQVNGDRHGDDQ